ncbi:alanine racemase [Capsulimonas corticalis]|uniref:Alanine racemase n=1 Tax=Capsulimonas corticalis TaxID=2219043 RepID=A0A402D5U5_9BACT|nr:LacI family DNA-binding transcriptional regulator [Capsulimonas corticalis]BDI32535.1 alanine racemase [Capsulimonas corticalis]
MTTIRDIATVCGVAPQTVMSAINNVPGKVSAHTRERILAVVREMNYRPGAARRRTPVQKSCTVGLIGGGSEPMRFGGSYYYTEVLTASIVAAGAIKQNVLIFMSEMLPPDPFERIRLSCDGRCEGLVVIEPSVCNPLIAALLDRGVPVVTIGYSGEYNHFVSTVDVDNAQGIRDVVAALWDAGHRRIAFAGMDRRQCAATARLEAFLEIAGEFGATVGDAFVHLPENSRPGDIAQWTASVLGAPASVRPSAVVCWNDTTAVEVIETARGLGLDVPRDLSVTGFDDDLRLAAAFDLTTIRQPYAQIGRRAVETLMGVIRRDDGAAQCVALPGELIHRGTIARPASCLL